MSLERRLLVQSCIAACVMALFEMWFGHTRQLRTVRVDGLINGFDVALILASFCVAGMIRRPANAPFQYGYWHWENWMQCLRGSVLILVCLYAA
jgi:predicted Co/Zn/Cd cation transporter (cation efflux family)